MKTDFETKLERFLKKNGIIADNNDYSNYAERLKTELKTLVADTLLKAIGENENEFVTHSGEPRTVYTRQFQKKQKIRNQLRSDIKAKVFEELGIKER